MEQTEAPEGQREFSPLQWPQNTFQGAQNPLQRTDSPFQGLLGKFVRVRVTHGLGTPFEALCPQGVVYGANFGELAAPAMDGAERPDGVFILGPRRPVRLFDGRVVALLY